MGERGRPTVYMAKYSEQVRKLCLLGMTDVELANFFEISEQTLNTWKRKHPEFLESMNAGKAEADSSVAEKLYQRALGYRHPAVKIFMPKGAERPVYAPYTERYPPDTQAASLWLRNRQPKKWRDKQEIENRTTLETSDPLTALLQRIACEGTKVYDPRFK